MKVFKEGNLEITFNNVVNAQKFDGHGLTCMKAVDFLVELPDRFLFIEFKDPFQSQSFLGKYKARFKSGQLDQDLKYKYRDSFLYEWAAGRGNKDCYYYVLVALDSLKSALLLRRIKALKYALPEGLPTQSQWTRPIVHGCGVFNIRRWNKRFPDYPVKRVA